MKTKIRICIKLLTITFAISILSVGCKKRDDLIIAPITFNSSITYGSMTDQDGNTYKTVAIGTQVWMAENLKTTKYRNGDLIGTTIPATLDIYPESTPKYQWAYNGNESIVAIYGRLYTWFAIADSRNVCPIGWHVPTDGEWHKLVLFLDSDAVLIHDGDESTIAGGKLKETNITHWTNPNTGSTNESGFTALPCGDRFDNGKFQCIDSIGYWWSSTEYSASTVLGRYMYYNKSNVRRADPPKKCAFSVRCLKDI